MKASEWSVEQWDRVGYALLGVFALYGLVFDFAFLWFLFWPALVVLITRRIVKNQQ